MKRKKKFKNRIKIMFFLAVLTIALLYGLKFYNEYQSKEEYKKSNEYKLVQKGYSIEEAQILLNTASEDRLNKFLTAPYNENNSKLITEKYYIDNYYDRYIDYINNNKNVEINKVISLVNVNRDRAYYENIIDTDTSLREGMLVNKYYKLSEDYVVEDLVPISPRYALANNSCSQIALDAFLEMYSDAMDNDIQLIVENSYISNSLLSDIWESNKSKYGTKRADLMGPRAGHSDYQTGFSLDLDQYNYWSDEFMEKPAYQWLLDNSYKYGYIQRYPKDKEDITGSDFDSCNFRYVGKDIAKVIHDEDITFDEYYAYYVENSR